MSKSVIWTGPYASDWPVDMIAGHSTSAYPSFLDRLVNSPHTDFILGWPMGQSGTESCACYYNCDPNRRVAYAYAFRQAQRIRNVNLTIGIYTGSVIGHPFERGIPGQVIDVGNSLAWWEYNLLQWRGDFHELSEVVLDAGAIPERWEAMLRVKEFLKGKMVKTRIEAIAFTPGTSVPDPKMALAIAQMGICTSVHDAAGKPAVIYSHPDLPDWTVPAGADWCLALQSYAGPGGPEVYVTADQLREFRKKGWQLWPDFAHEKLVGSL